MNVKDKLIAFDQQNFENIGYFFFKLLPYNLFSY